MEFLLLILAFVIGLAVLDATAAEVGVDSRFDIDDSHAPLHGASLTFAHLRSARHPPPPSSPPTRAR